MARVKHRRKKPVTGKLAELAIAAPQVVAIRTARMLACANPSPADRAEFSQMSREKVQAFWESMFAMGTQTMTIQQEYMRTAAQSWARAWMTPWWLGAKPSIAALTLTPTRRQRNQALSKLAAAGLAPVHKKATANARRLTKVGKR